MTPLNMRIRKAVTADIPVVVQITKDNRHFWTPEVDGAEALARVLERDTNVFLVSVSGKIITGFVLGSWDGARAIIHKISVSPDSQGLGIGTALVASAVDEFKKMGAPTVGVSAADGTRSEEESSIEFWEKCGFVQIPARFMINFDIWDDEDHEPGALERRVK